MVGSIARQTLVTSHIMADLKSSKHLDQVQLEGDRAPVPAPQAGRNLVQNPLKVSTPLERS